VKRRRNVVAAGGPSANEARFRTEAERGRRDVERMQKQIAELEATRERLSRLYFTQVDDNRKRSEKLHHLLEVVSQINSTRKLEELLTHIAEAIQKSLGFRIVLLRIREPGTTGLVARAFAGLDAAARERLGAQVVQVEDFLSWLRDEFRVSRSYFISHINSFSKVLPQGYVPDLGERADWEWHGNDVLFVPLFSRSGELLGYFSVDDPVDRLIPSRELVELLEIFSNHAVVAIENARLNADLEQRNRQLEEASQRMVELNALKSNFVSIVSHELRTPLTAIRAYVDALQTGIDEVPADQLRRFFSIIDEQSQRLSRLIESVLDLSRFDSGVVRSERKPVRVGEVVQETARMLEPVARTAQVALKVVEAVDDTLVDADRDQIGQLVLHLASNAVKFTLPGGEVRLRASADQDQVTLDVEDTGIGIAERELGRIFERFYQVDSSLVRRYGGTGLGLAICKSIVDGHGGTITATSTPDKGSCFRVVLPKRRSARVILRRDSELEKASASVLRMAVEMVAEVMDARVVSLMRLTPRGELVVEAAQGLDQRVVDEVRIERGQGVAGWVAEHRRPVCVSRSEEASEVAPSGRRQYRSGTFLSVPLEGKDGLLGVLNVTDPVSRKELLAEDCHMLLVLAERVAAAWEQALQLAQDQAGVEDAAETLRTVLTHLQRGRRAAPNRVRLASAIARRLGLTEAQAGMIGYVASVHDVGMATVGEDVLSGARKLDDEKRAAVEQHAERGVEIMRPLEVVGAVREMILAHHEWWNGSGYPRGLRGDQIPIGARILSVVDAFESMTAGRAYRPARTGRQALEEIRSLAGQQFDPAVVDAIAHALHVAELDDETQPGPFGDDAPQVSTAGR